MGKLQTVSRAMKVGADVAWVGGLSYSTHRGAFRMNSEWTVGPRTQEDHVEIYGDMSGFYGCKSSMKTGISAMRVYEKQWNIRIIT